MTTPGPFLSVVMPVLNGEKVLRESLPALLASDLPRSLYEIILVDDGSNDQTTSVAAEYADVVICLPPLAKGPAYARNRGVEVSRGEVVVFIDADVCVHSDALRKIAGAFAADAGLAAVFGSYDADPTAPGLVSQFRNLLHHHVHQAGAGAAETFWAGCGAVRREALLDVGLMDAWHFARPQIEDIELGRRLRRAGYRIALRPDIQCTHLKRWTLRNMIVTDFRDRGTPWMWLILSEGATRTPATLNLKMREKLCTALAGLFVLFAGAAALMTQPALLFGSALSLLGILALNWRFYGFLQTRRGWWFCAQALPLHLIFYVTGGAAGVTGILMHYAVGVPGRPAAVTEAAGHASGWPPRIDRPDTSIWAMAATRVGK